MRQALGPGELGKPRGSGWRGRWEGEIRMGNTCKPMADSFQCMTKFTTNLKKIIPKKENTLMLGKIEGRKRRGQQRMRWHHRLNGHEFE